MHNTGSDLLRPGRQLLLAAREGEPAAHAAITVRRAPKHLIVELAEVTSREAAEQLKGARVLVPRAELPALEPGEFYVEDLVGMEVRAVDVHIEDVHYAPEES